ncbi:MAG: hypothetical protein LQ343_001194 [Gyalolechia ehrenbergii]|nr:MAG: hypothetical protein LQ343_001194 [Gyalolechia ehrenbergii]
MRLFLLPISTKRSLIYCQRLNRQTTSETNLGDKITTRASNIWLKWEKAEKGWKKKVTAYGNKLFARIPHEEWGLKSVPPLSKRRGDEELKGRKEVSVVFPGSVISEEGVQEALRKYAGDERQGFHTKWMWGSFLINNQLLKITPSPDLDVAYTEAQLDASMKELDSEFESVLEKPIGGHPASTNNPEVERMLLLQASGKYIADLVDVPGLEEHVQRAVKQVEKSLSAKQELKEEKEELEEANNMSDTRR